MLVILDQEAGPAPEALACVPAWFEDWEQSLSRFRADSELSRVNRTFDQPVPVSDALWEVYQASVWAERFTNGLVTPTVHDAMLEAGYDKSFDELPRYQRDASSTSVMLQPLSVVLADEAAHTLCLPRGVHLDFGGVAKGWAAHQAMTVLQAEGPALVDAGGDISISGPHSDGSAWEIGVRNPFERETDFEFLYVERGGVATSGRDRRRWLQGNRLRHHLIDPLTGQPAVTDVSPATVVAPTVMEAEAAAKAALLMGAEDGLRWIESRPELAALVVLENGQALYSKRMLEYL
jgi:thiamine biosynthesis lipoprotein